LIYFLKGGTVGASTLFSGMVGMRVLVSDGNSALSPPQPALNTSTIPTSNTLTTRFTSVSP
jgi:hypothetical protein